jgi:hypothetical protein
LQALDAFRNRPASEIKDQLVHADRRESSDITGDVFRRAGGRDPPGDGMPVS